jgi:hypothetical protein
LDQFKLSVFDPTAPFSDFRPSYYREASIAPLSRTNIERVALEGLDSRPATGELYFLTRLRSRVAPGVDFYNLYTLRPSNTGLTGSATSLGTVSLPSRLSVVAFTFNAAQDRIHIIFADGQHLRVNPTDRTVVADAPLAPGGQSVVDEAAYDKDDNLYVIGSDQKLYRQSASSPATLTEVGSLGQNEGGSVTSFAIGRTSNSAYLFRRLNTGFSGLYSVNLATGATTAITDQFAFSGFDSGVLAVGLGF